MSRNVSRVIRVFGIVLSAFILTWGVSVTAAASGEDPTSTSRDEATVSPCPDCPTPCPHSNCCGGHGPHGEPVRRGQGWGRGRGAGPGPGQGPRGAHHENIHALLDRHDSIERQVEEVDGGVETITTSADPEVAERIREHVREMRDRMESGWGMRRWDPLFVELFRQHDKIRMEIEDVPGGVRVRETSEDPEVARLIRQHAERAVSEFVDGGHARAHLETPLPEGYGGPSKTVDPAR